MCPINKPRCSKVSTWKPPTSVNFYGSLPRPLIERNIMFDGTFWSSCCAIFVSLWISASFAFGERERERERERETDIFWNVQRFTCTVRKLLRVCYTITFWKFVPVIATRLLSRVWKLGIEIVEIHWATYRTICFDFCMKNLCWKRFWFSRAVKFAKWK